jgi:hypothetical protein
VGGSVPSALVTFVSNHSTSWTSGTRLTELIISQEAGCGFTRNVPKFLTLIKSPVHSPRASNFRRSRSRTPLFITVANVLPLVARFNRRIKDVLNVCAFVREAQFNSLFYWLMSYDIYFDGFAVWHLTLDIA